MRTLLTGASGYVGLHVLREMLARGHEVTAVVRSRYKLGPFGDDTRVRVVETDLERDATVAQAVPGHDVFVHAALLWGAPGSELEARDIAVAAKLFDAAARVGLTRSIYVSSTAVHFPLSAEMGEDDMLRTAGVYGATKAAGELFLRAACAQSEMRGVVVRPGPVVGAPAFDGGSHRLHRQIGKMVDAAREGRSIDVIEGEGRQLVDVSTVARAIRLLAERDGPHPTYLCVDRQVTPWEDVAKTVVECLRSASEVRVLPREDDEVVPRFRTERIEGLLGGPTDAGDALRAQIRCLA